MKILHFVWGVLLTLMVGACSNEMDGLIAEENQPLLNFTAGFDGNSDSRTVLVDGHKVEWLQGDKVVLFDGESSAIYVASASGAKTTFVYESGDELSMNGTYTAVYPVSALNVTDKTIQVKKSQTAVAGGFDPDAAICMAVVATGKDVVSFKNVCALLKFNVCPAFAANAQGMVMTATGGVVNKGGVSTDGTATITWSEPGNEDYSIWGTFSADEDYYLLVAPQTFSTGFTATMMSATSAEIDEGRSTNKSISFEASKVYSLDEIRHIVPEQEWYYGVLAKDPNATEFVIRTPEEMMAFIEIVNSMSASSLPFTGKTVKLGNDIDMKEYEGSIVPIQKFWGTFDGQNHKIKNLHIVSDLEYAGLFSRTYRSETNAEECTVIKDLILEGGSVESTYSPGYNAHFGAVGAFVGYFQGKIINCHNRGCNVSGEAQGVGGIVGYCNTTQQPIWGCSNSAEITGTGLFYNTWYGGNVGGIIGYAYMGYGIAGCYNTGDIVSSQYGGGIVGNCNESAIYGCYNDADVTAFYNKDDVFYNKYGAGAFAGRTYISHTDNYGVWSCALPEGCCELPDGSQALIGECLGYQKGAMECYEYKDAVDFLNVGLALYVGHSGHDNFPFRFKAGDTPALEYVE